MGRVKSSPMMPVSYVNMIIPAKGSNYKAVQALLCNIVVFK